MALKGNLNDLPLAELLQSLSGAKSTGALFVYNGKREAVLYLREGELVHCTGDCPAGEENFFEIMNWENGNFEFIRDRTSPKETISASIPRLIMESAKRKDEENAFPARQSADGEDAVAMPSSVPKLVETLPTEEVYLNTLEWGILSGIDGKRSLEEIAQEKNLSIRSVGKIINDLLKKQIVKLHNKE